MNDTLTVPARLNKGDAIGFVSPSAGLAPFAMHRIERAKAFFEQEGYRIIMAPHALSNTGYTSGSIDDRIKDLHWLFEHQDVRLIMATIGGNHCVQLLPYLDYELIKSHPKIFVGYSDMTILHYACITQAHLATYYGPCVMTQFGEYPTVFEYTYNSFQKTLVENHNTITHNIFPSIDWTDEILDWFAKTDLSRPRKRYSNFGYQFLL